MERIVFKYLYNYFHNNNLFYKYHAEFLSGHSTVFQLIETYDCILKAELSWTVLCGLSEAFDRVWHKGLFKLQTYSVIEIFLNSYKTT